MNLISESLTYLFSQSMASMFLLFAIVIIFEIPRYFLLFLVGAFMHRPKQRPLEAAYRHRVTVIVAGHNEEDAFPRCVASLKEQSRPPDEIVAFSDGSTDRTAEVLRNLLAKGEIDKAYATDLRGGKSAGLNVCERLATGEIVVNIDCDCSLDRDAIRRIVEPFEDPDVGSVAGNIQVRNPEASLLATAQAIEYLVTLSLGKQSALVLDQVTCSSGGFSAFRKSALEETGGADAGGGEDLDATLRLRAYGWKIGFRADAVCYTDVPVKLSGLVRQRFRWERDAIRLRFRKYAFELNPFDPRFKISEVLHQIEFLVFNVIGAALMPFYVAWLFIQYGSFAIVLLLSVKLVLIFLDLIVFLMAAYTTPYVNSMRLLPYVVAYTFYNGILMRFVRLGAYLDEWLLDSSYRDSYVPQKVHDVRGK
ncbi:glycosyltransferase family 2 protein [Roseibium litorale]|uniref:Glycosyltransferase family 2 protein n=1 Tax=Roseibium litorale TaxID=2803841 RepID=A0ABR9CRZ7_9HYPH|nr:glycosyltransferase [Roseibium litorale]MBD8893655.1 glycosyltransferase family 2 protein [Roseibium litorale]